MGLDSRFTAGVLFSGIGGADVGLHQAGFDVVWAIERDPVAASIYAKNFNHDPIVEDVRTVDLAKLRQVDLIWASPPCQQYSTARSKKLPQHEGADAGLAVIRYLDLLRPRYFCLENVEGYKKSSAFREIMNALYRFEYWVEWSILNAADFGVPQSRRRLILRAIRGGIPASLVSLGNKLGWYQAICDLVSGLPETNLAAWQKKVLLESGCDVGEGLWLVCGSNSGGKAKKNILKPQNTPYWTVAGTSRWDRLLLIPRVGARVKNFHPIGPSEPAPTIRALGHDRHWRQLDVIAEKKVYKVTPRCFARFQTFPDDFWLPDDPVIATKGIGNAVPCQLARTVGASVLEGWRNGI